MFKLTLRQLRSIASLTHVAADNREPHVELRGVHVEVNDQGWLTALATDQHRMAMIRFEVESDGPFAGKLLSKEMLRRFVAATTGTKFVDIPNVNVIPLSDGSTSLKAPDQGVTMTGHHKGQLPPAVFVMPFGTVRPATSFPFSAANLAPLHRLLPPRINKEDLVWRSAGTVGDSREAGLPAPLLLDASHADAEMYYVLSPRRSFTKAV